MQARLDIEEIGVYGKCMTDICDEMLEKSFEKPDIPDGVLFDQIFIDKDIIVVFKDPELAGKIGKSNFRVSPIYEIFLKKTFYLIPYAGICKIFVEVQAFEG